MLRGLKVGLISLNTQKHMRQLTPLQAYRLLQCYILGSIWEFYEVQYIRPTYQENLCKFPEVGQLYKE